MTSTPVLALPDYTLPFTLETDASALGVGAVLMQQGRPLAYMSKGLSPKHQGLSTYEKELLAIVLATQKWGSYLQGHHFVIKTDHQSLKYFLEQRLSSLLQQKWLAKLLGLDYEIVYKKGVDNKVADALSRLSGHDNTWELSAISTLNLTWIQEVIESYTSDITAQQMITGIITKEPAYAQYQYTKGLIKIGDRIYIGTSGNVRQNLMQELHDGPAGDTHDKTPQ